MGKIGKDKIRKYGHLTILEKVASIITLVATR